MPYNNTPIAPREEISGMVSLPLARVKKIIHADEDLNSCSNNAAFAITVATELFLKYLVEQTQNVVKSERKPRRNIQYKDVATAVARIDNLEFLTDVVPRTTTFKQFEEKQSKAAAGAAGGPQTNGTGGQTTLDAQMGGHHAQGSVTTAGGLDGVEDRGEVVVSAPANHSVDVEMMDTSETPGPAAPHANGVRSSAG